MNPAHQVSGNYQSGRLAIKCIINRFCPCNASAAVQDLLVFNSETAKTLSEDILQSISIVPGDTGWFLKPKYNKRSNFLAANGKDVKYDIIEGKSAAGGNPFQQIITSVQNAISGLINAVTGLFGQPATPTTTSSEDDIPYKTEYTFEIKKSVFEGDDITLPHPDEDYNKDDKKYAKARWRYGYKPRGIDADDPDQPGNPNDYERIDGRIAILYQDRAKDRPKDPTSESSDTAIEPVHWKLDKKTNLFWGEDFFVEFLQVAETSDASNSPSTSFTNISDNPAYMCIDSTITDQSPPNGGIPCNQGVLSYEPVTDDKGKVTSYTPVEDNRKFLDLNRQPYLILEIGKCHDKHNYFIIITEKYYPTCVRVTNFLGQLTSFPLGIYPVVSGKKLLELKNFTVTVRNHLGRLVVTFSGFEDQPWIIAQKPFDSTDVRTIEVPNAPITLWGGNLKAGINFGILEYNQKYKLSLPPKDKDFGHDPLGNKRKFELPKKGTEGYLGLLSTTDYGIDLTAYAAVTLSGGIDEYIERRQPLYTCDTQLVGELRVDNTSNSVGVSSSIETFSPFMDTGRFLKEFSGVNAVDNFAWFLRIVQEKIASAATTIEIYLDAILGESAKPSPDANKINNIKIAIQNKEEELMGHVAAKKEIMKILEELVEGLNKENKSSIVLDYIPIPDESTEYVNVFALSATLKAGNHLFDSGWMCMACKTPVITHLQLVAMPNDESAWETKELDASELVMRFSDTWSAQDFHVIEHTGSIDFLVTRGQYLNDTARAVEALQDKAFYVEIDAGYVEPGLKYTGNNAQLSYPGKETQCNYSRIPGLYRLFTGICYGGNIKVEAGNRIMTCELHDYSKILQDQLFFNSPFFDGMRDLNAAHMILKLAGFKDKDAQDPGYYARMGAEHRGNDYFRIPSIDGRLYKAIPYALPASYQRLQQPFFKWQDGQKMYEGLNEITKRAGKVMFFDNYGQFHYESLPFDSYLYGNDSFDDIKNDLALWYFTSSTDGYGQQVFNIFNIQSAMNDVINNIHILSTTPDYELIIDDDMNWDSMHKPEVTGFLGYRKTYLQQDGIFGSQVALRRLVAHYSKLYRPPTVATFETYGQPLRCFDVAIVDSQPLIITNVSSELDPSQNRWWQNIEGEWYQPAVFGTGDNNPSPTPVPTPEEPDPDSQSYTDPD